jgi:SAM-dependent methyltransferase
MVHAIHLIAEWPAAIEEARRVLKPQGIFMTGFNYHPSGSEQERVREKWKDIVHHYYRGLLEPGSQRFEEVKAYLNKTGAVLDEWTAARWSKPFHLGRFIESLEQKIYSSSWFIPEPTFQQSIADLRAWAKVEFGSLDHEVQQPHEFIWQRFRWE